MDKNVSAMLHVHGAVIASLIATHPNPEAFSQAFTFHLAQVGESLQTEDMKAMVSVWARTYRRHIPPTPEASPSV